MDPVLTTPEGRISFGSRPTEGSSWTLFCVFWHQKWPGGVSAWGFLITLVAATGQSGVALPSPWPNQDHGAAWSGEKEGGVRWFLRSLPLWDSGIPWFGRMGWWHCAPPVHPPGSQAGLGLSELGWESGWSNPQSLKSKGRRASSAASPLQPKPSFPSANRVQSVTCHVLYWKG